MVGCCAGFAHLDSRDGSVTVCDTLIQKHMWHNWSQSGFHAFCSPWFCSGFQGQSLRHDSNFSEPFTRQKFLNIAVASPPFLGVNQFQKMANST
jgi:hypothetical protein